MDRLLNGVSFLVIFLYNLVQKHLLSNLIIEMLEFTMDGHDGAAKTPLAIRTSKALCEVHFLGARLCFSNPFNQLLELNRMHLSLRIDRVADAFA